MKQRTPTQKYGIRCNIIKIHTLIGPTKPLKHPRRNLIEIAIQKLVLRPKRVLKITLRRKKINVNAQTYKKNTLFANVTPFHEQNLLLICKIKQNIYTAYARCMHFFGSTNTEMVHNNIIGFRPYRSAAIPHKMAVKALPIINEAASRNKI